MPLGKSASAGDWIRDFRQSSAPQFAGKSPQERQRMALGAYYANKRRAAGGLVNPRRLAAGGLNDSLMSNQSTSSPPPAPSSAPQVPTFEQGTGVQYSPGGMPQGGYNQAEASGQWWSPGGMTSGGTGFPLDVQYPQGVSDWSGLQGLY